MHMNKVESGKIETFLKFKAIFNLQLSKKNRILLIESLFSGTSETLEPNFKALFSSVLNKHFPYKSLFLKVKDKTVFNSYTSILNNLGLTAFSSLQVAYLINDLFEFAYLKVFHKKSAYNTAYFDFYKTIISDFKVNLRKNKKLHTIRSKARAKRKYYPTEYLFTTYKDTLDIKEASMGHLGYYTEREFVYFKNYFAILWKGLPRKLQRDKKQLFQIFITRDYYFGIDNNKYFEKALKAYVNDFLERYKRDYDLIDRKTLPLLMQRYKSTFDIQIEPIIEHHNQVIQMRVWPN